MIAWGENMVRCAGTDPLRFGLDERGKAHAGFASLQRARTLFSTTELIDCVLHDASASPCERQRVETRIKNIDLLDLLAPEVAVTASAAPGVS